MLNHPVKIQFVTPQEKDQAIEKLLQQQGYSNEEHQKNDFPTVDRVAEPKPPAFETSTVPSKDTGLNPKYTFDTFVVGNSNRLTHAAIFIAKIFIFIIFDGINHLICECFR